MNSENKILLKNDSLTVIIGIALIIYLYLDTPVPAKLMLNNYFLFIVLFIVGYIFYILLNKVNMFVAILFALVAFEIIRKSMKPDLNNINKKIAYYDNFLPTSERVISEKLKVNNTLEQEMVNIMKQTKIANDYPRRSPRYQPIVPNIAGFSQIE